MARCPPGGRGRGSVSETICSDYITACSFSSVMDIARVRHEDFRSSALPAVTSIRRTKAWSGPVSRILWSLRTEDHSSVTRVAAVIEQPTRKLIADTGGSIASLFGLAPQGVCHAVAAHAGRGALLPHRFTLTSARPKPCGSAVCSLLHFPSCHHAWPLASLLPVGVRTFLHPLHFRSRNSDPPVRSTQGTVTGCRRGKILRVNHCCLRGLERMSAGRHQKTLRFVGSEK